MKVCPKCNKSYDDDNLNFCLNDGEMLMETETIDAPPTIMMDASRQTKENWNNFDTEQAQPNPHNQQLFQQPFGTPQGNMQTASKDQTLPIVAVVSGTLSVVLSICCYAGIFIGPIALITGFMGMNNANKHPEIFDGKNLAIVGMIAGGLGILISLAVLIVFLLSLLA